MSRRARRARRRPPLGDVEPFPTPHGPIATGVVCWPPHGRSPQSTGHARRRRTLGGPRRRRALPNHAPHRRGGHGPRVRGGAARPAQARGAQAGAGGLRRERRGGDALRPRGHGDRPIDHPHVASAIDYGQLADGTTYLVMQLVRGENLAERMCRQRVPWPEACGIAAQIADALSAAHREGIVHRNLKPDNVMLSARDDGTPHVRVLDFGIARVPAEPHAAPAGAAPNRPLTKIGTVVGTPGYMAPEQALDEPVGPRSDLYTLGILLWESIVGKGRFPENDLTRIVTRQLSQAAPRLAEASGNPSVPTSLQERVDELLAGSPDARPRDAAVVRDALRSVVARASLSGARRFPLPPSPTPTTAASVPSDDVPTQRLASATSAPPTATSPAIPSARGAADEASRSSRPPNGRARPSLLRRSAPAIGLLIRGPLADGVLAPGTRGPRARAPIRVAREEIGGHPRDAGKRRLRAAQARGPSVCSRIAPPPRASLRPRRGRAGAADRMRRARGRRDRGRVCRRRAARAPRDTTPAAPAGERLRRRWSRGLLRLHPRRAPPDRASPAQSATPPSSHAVDPRRSPTPRLPPHRDGARVGLEPFEPREIHEEVRLPRIASRGTG